MSDVIVVGDGPGGLSAALLLAKNGADVDVFGTDDTPMHKAMLYNYLGIPEMTGTEFQKTSREQVKKLGANLVKSRVEKLEKSGDVFRVETADGKTQEAKFIILATTNKAHQKALGVERENGAASVDRNGRTNVDGCYAIGWASRKDKIQAIISAGDGAAAAIDILSRQKGEPFHDFDVV